MVMSMLNNSHPRRASVRGHLSLSEDDERVLSRVCRALGCGHIVLRSDNVHTVVLKQRQQAGDHHHQHQGSDELAGLRE